MTKSKYVGKTYYDRDYEAEGWPVVQWRCDSREPRGYRVTRTDKPKRTTLVSVAWFAGRDEEGRRPSTEEN